MARMAWNTGKTAKSRYSRGCPHTYTPLYLLSIRGINQVGREKCFRVIGDIGAIEGFGAIGAKRQKPKVLEAICQSA
jgi:hypothetical protein